MEKISFTILQRPFNFFPVKELLLNSTTSIVSGRFSTTYRTLCRSFNLKVNLQAPNNGRVSGCPPQ